MTFETGEDFHVSHTMRKYANIGTYVMPFQPDDDETRGSKFRGLSFVNAATTSRCHSAMGLIFTLKLAFRLLLEEYRNHVSFGLADASCL